MTHLDKFTPLERDGTILVYSFERVPWNNIFIEHDEVESRQLMEDLSLILAWPEMAHLRVHIVMRPALVDSWLVVGEGNVFLDQNVPHHSIILAGSLHGQDNTWRWDDWRPFYATDGQNGIFTYQDDDATVGRIVGWRDYIENAQRKRYPFLNMPHYPRRAHASDFPMAPSDARIGFKQRTE